MEGYEAGADDYIAKPFDHDELLAKIRVYLRLKSAEEIGSLRSNLITLLQHETRTPMAVLAGALETLKTCLPLDSFATQSMRMAEAAAEQLHRLHERIVLLSKLRSGYSTLSPTVTDISVLVRQCAASRDSAAIRAQVRMTCKSVDGAWTRFDPEYTNSVFGELLDNALRYTPAGGEVRIESAREGEVVTIRVTDTGAGIPAEALSTIMDEFVVGDIRHHRRGTGLGLAIVRELLAALNGTVSFESVENRGTTVVLTFPAAELESGEGSGSEAEIRAA
jgi:signal transduction histidine kinase